MPRGANPKRERELDRLKTARMINKQRAHIGESKQAMRPTIMGEPLERDLPITDYQKLSVEQILTRALSLSRNQIERVVRFERNHKNRKTVLEGLERAA
ncbi:MAG TPA: hypothetical protein VFY29_21390 [Terriglobia bacterium]|nr:hypothetical protein [Terriglobia bacterium]